MKKEIVPLIILSLFFASSVFAASAYITPSGLEKVSGAVFNANLGINPQGANACVVSGKLSFSGLTCRSITVASGIMAQVSPTCSNPSFMLGIPGCSQSAKTILSVSVKAGAEGTGLISVSDLGVISEAGDLAVSLTPASYIITPVPALIEEQPKEEEPLTEDEVLSQDVALDEVVGYVDQEALIAGLSSPLKSITNAVSLVDILVLIVILLVLLREWLLHKERKGM